MQKQLLAAADLYNTVRPQSRAKGQENRFPPITPNDIAAMARDFDSDAALLKYIVGVIYDGLVYGNWLENRKAG